MAGRSGATWGESPVGGHVDPLEAPREPCRVHLVQRRGYLFGDPLELFDLEGGSVQERAQGFVGGGGP